MKKLQGWKVTLEQIKNSDFVVSGKEWIIPIRATLLSHNTGTVVETESNQLFLISMGDWFRSSYYTSHLPQVSIFDTLQDLGLTVIKDKIVRKDYKKPEQGIIPNGQKIRVQNNVGPQKVDKAMAPNIKSEKKD